MTITYHTDIEQGSLTWLNARCGLISASEMKLIVSPPPKEETRVKKNGEPYKQREWIAAADDDACRKHVYELAAQRITKFVEPIFESMDMIRGKADEAEARAMYADRYGPVEEMGLVTNDEWGFTLAYSPDGLTQGRTVGIECKARRQKFQVQTVIEYLETGSIPSEFVMQCQTGILVAKLKWLDLVSYSRKLPVAIMRVHPDDEIRNAIIEAAGAANERIAKIVADYGEATSQDLEIAA